MSLFEEERIRCPYCHETLWLEVDITEGSDQRFILDCEICCRPIEVHAIEKPRGGYRLIAAFDDSVG